MTSLSVTEGNSGTTNAVFTVLRLSGAGYQSITVNHAAADGDGHNSGQRLCNQQRLAHLAPGRRRQTITVAVNGEFWNEPDEAFFVNL